MDVVNEKSSSDITVSFFDKTGTPAVPVSITYSTKCMTTGTAIKTAIAVTPAAVITISLDALDSAIQNSMNSVENKLLTVQATYGIYDQCNDDYTWQVRNMASA
jgi:ribulose kinase